jgi:hypothetical protein
VITGYKLPADGFGFTSEELVEAYLLASKSELNKINPVQGGQLEQLEDSLIQMSHGNEPLNTTVLGTWRYEIFRQAQREELNSAEACMTSAAKTEAYLVEAPPKRKGVAAYGKKKYKPVALKVKPVKATLPSEFRIEREIRGDPLKNMPELPTNPKPWVPNQTYTAEKMEVINENHAEGFLWPAEMTLLLS